MPKTILCRLSIGYSSMHRRIWLRHWRILIIIRKTNRLMLLRNQPVFSAKHSRMSKVDGQLSKRRHKPSIALQKLEDVLGGVQITFQTDHNTLLNITIRWGAQKTLVISSWGNFKGFMANIFSRYARLHTMLPYLFKKWFCYDVIEEWSSCLHMMEKLFNSSI